MEHSLENLDRRIARQSAMTYIAISLVVALATVKGGYTDVARFGGALWVFLLRLIVTMPLVTACNKKHSKN